MRERPTVSITIVGGEADFDAIRRVAAEFIDYFRWNEVDGAVVRVLSPSVEDRTTVIDGVYEYKVGFDIRIDYTEEKTRSVERVKSVELASNVNDEERETILVGE